MKRDSKGKEDEVVLHLPVEVQPFVDATIEWLIGVEKEGRQPSDVAPFSHVSEQMRAKGEEYFSDLYSEFVQAHNLIYKEFLNEERMEPTRYGEDASFACWSQAIEKAKQKISALPPGTTLFTLPEYFAYPLHEELDLSWAFMDRLYDTATRLLHEKRYQESKQLFQLLRCLHGEVSAYWYGAGRCEEELGDAAGALETFLFALLFDPTNASIYFQIARCYHDLKEIESCRKALDFCIHYGSEQPEKAELVMRAKKAREALPMGRRAA